MRAKTRASVVLLAGLTTLGGAATAEAAQLQATVAVSPAVEVRETLVDLGVPVPSPRVMVRGVKRLARAAELAETPRFPIDGEFNWGQSGATYGSARSGHVHEGQDVFAPTGRPLVAVTDGVVAETGNDGGRGNYVAIFDPDAKRTYVYFHMSVPSLVEPGTHVRAGRRVGAVGCTGSCFGNHLHFEIRRGRGPAGPSLDPLPELEHWADVHRAEATLPPGAS